MADKKLSTMTQTSTASANDIMLLVVDPSGDPLNKTITVQNLQETVLSSRSDGVDSVLKQYDGIEVGRIHDCAVVPTVSGSGTPTLTG